MAVPTAVVREAFVNMQNQGALKKGDELPRSAKMLSMLGLKRTPYNLALWQLVVRGEVSRIDQRHFWGNHPKNTRSKDQIHLILLRAVAEDLLEEGDVFPTAGTIDAAYNATRASAVSRLLVEQKIITANRRRKYVSIGAKARAEQAVASFQFGFSAIEKQADDLFASLEEQQSHAEATAVLQEWRREISLSSIEPLFFSSQLLSHFGAATTSRVSAIKLQKLPLEVLVERVGACRQWLRRNHFVNDADALLIIMQHI